VVAAVIEAMPGFTFGCDPELFVRNSDGEFVTAEGLIPGTKEEPFKVDGGAVQVDGMAAEFNIDPVSTFTGFNDNIVKVISQLKKMLPAGHTLVAEPAVVFSEKEWERTPDIAKVLGCTPDFNAWTGQVNPPPDATGQNERLRTASGHLHFGWTDDGIPTDPVFVGNCRDLVKQLDWHLGAWSLSKDSDPRRRELYGRAGAMRFKPYGVEYRVLSNFWLSRKADRLAVWNRMQNAIKNMRTSFMPETAYQFNDLLIEDINNTKLSDTLKFNFANPVMTI